VVGFMLKNRVKAIVKIKDRGGTFGSGFLVKIKVRI
jgi:hypothetical protein